jgi:phosphoribosylformylglycinamidine synthase
LGICNGFQILLKSGVLLPDKPDDPIATLTLNASGKFEDRWVHLRVASPKCVFLQGIEQMYLPVAHAEGQFIARDEATLRKLDEAGQLVLRYTTQRGQRSEVRGQTETSDFRPPTSDLPVRYPACPNGAQLCTAGMCDETGRVFGLMPHPERHIDPTQHPRWTRERRERGDGLAVFENAVRFFR